MSDMLLAFHLVQTQVERQAAALQSMYIDYQHLQQQEEEVGRMRGKLNSKLEVLREQAVELESLQASKRQLEEQVSLCMLSRHCCIGVVQVS